MSFKIKLIYCFLIFSVCSWGQKNFTSLSVDNGLSHNSVLSIAQDNEGLIWFGTQDGLNVYDGETFKTYRSGTVSGLSDNVVNCLYNDTNGLWIGTENGLNYFNTINQKFTSFFVEDYPNLTSNTIKCVFPADETSLWIGTDQGISLLKITANKTTFTAYPFEEDRSVNAILKTKSNQIWIGTDQGVFYFKDNRFYEHEHLKNINVNTNALAQDADGNVWIGTLNSGLIIYHTNKSKTIISQSKAYLANNDIRSIHVDKAVNEIWVGTNNSGLLIFKDANTVPVTYDVSLTSKTAINSTTIMDVFKDTFNNTWLGTYEGGVNMYNPYQKSFGWRKPAMLADYNITSVGSSKQKSTIWLGTRSKGVYKYNEETDSVVKIKTKYSLNNTPILSLKEDVNNQLWIGTHRKGLFKYNPLTQKLERYLSNNNDNRHIISIRKIIEKNNGELWVIGSSGIHKYHPRKNNFETYNTRGVNDAVITDQQIITVTNQSVLLIDKKTKQFKHINFPSYIPISNYLIGNCVYLDKQKRLWIGTKSFGLLSYHLKTKKFKHYTVKEGLPNNIIKGILPDDDNQIWLSTNKGLSKFNPATLHFTNYLKLDGLQGNDFRNRSCVKMQDGKLVFGGVNGFNVFNPKNISQNPLKPNVLFTDFRISNTRATDSLSNIKLKKHINNTEQITLKYYQSSIKFTLATTNFLNSEKNKYTYILENYQTNWSVPSTSNDIAFVNLPSGEFVLKVKSANNDGVWNETPKHIKITVLPPLWKTWWAYLLYLLAILTILFLFIYFYLREQKLKSQIAVNKSISNLKLELFTNISHEFRTPLTLILAPLQKILAQNKLEASIEKNIKGIYHNANRLQQMIDQLLDFRRLENNHETVVNTVGDLVSFFKKITYSFQALAEEKGITLSFNCINTSYITAFDADKLEKISYNLLSNAFKFTSQGDIKLDLHIHEDHYTIGITDTGIGIKKEHIPLIFKRFYSNNTNNQNTQKSSGIGLYYVQELVNLLGGKIEVDSNYNKGTSFKVSVPKIEISQENNLAHPTDHEKPVILIVEDEPEIRALLKDEFKTNYTVLEAENGAIGLALAKEHIPDIIISDVTMPLLNGLELCEKIRASEKTNHIPIILLTAITNDAQKMEGLEKGANDYINKPFNVFEIKTKVENSILSRKIISQKLQQQLSQDTTTEFIQKEDAIFLEHAKTIVEKNIDNSDFNVQQFTKEIGMSRAQLYRKIDAVVGLPVKDFVRTIRLKNASEKLLKTTLQVNEIAYAVGFNNVPYFRKCFKKQYHCTPKEYRAKNM